MIHSSYLFNVLDRDKRRKSIREICKIIKKEQLEFDTIAFSGMSGSLIAPIIADKLKKQMILVRKGKDDTHSHCSCEGFKDVKRYIIVDDGISTGATLKRIKDRISQFNLDAVPVGIFMYNGYFESQNDLAKDIFGTDLIKGIHKP